MGQGDRHIIRSASLEVNAGSAAAVPGGAFGFQNDAVRWAQDRLLAELEEIFAGLPLTGVHVLIDRLEISLDAADATHWGDDILPRLRAELHAALAKGLREGGLGPGEERLGPGASFLRKLAFYLQHGVLPWNLAASTRADLETGARELLDSEYGPATAADLSVAWKLPSARLRFLEAFPVAFTLQVLRRLFHFPGYLAQAWARDAAHVLPSPGSGNRAADTPSSPRTLPPLLMEEILSALSHNPRLFEQGLDEEIVHAYLGRVLLQGRIQPGMLRTLPFESPAFAASRDRLLRLPPTPGLREPEILSGPENRLLLQGSPDSDQRATADLRDPGDPFPGASGAALEGIHIANAGLIVLAPFLSMLFERLGLSDKAGLKDAAHAIALIHYLATGEEGPAEFQVPLAKILCGCPLEKALTLPSTLPDSLKSEADQLLESVIGHWGVLKNTSVNGLRESFLQRPGKLSRRPQGDWLLQVEQRAFDMLLQQLPWSFALIRMPWMKTVLRTEWVE